MVHYTFVEKWLRIFVLYVFPPVILILTKPIGIIFDLVLYHPIFRSTNSPEKHKRKVEEVQKQVREWNRKGKKTRMCTGRPAWKTLSLRNLVKKNMTQIVIDLEDIIEIDTYKKVLRVESGMVMGALTIQLLNKGWTIPVIPEFESLSVGGCVSGTGIETTSHKYGLFADSCVGYEVVLADGSVVNCSKDENSDIFYAMSWSHGSIGFLTAVTIPLIPAKKYVKLEYTPTTSMAEATKLLKTEGKEFIEGIMFGLNQFVIMFGTLEDRAEPNMINNVNGWNKPWFYKHVESYLSKGPAAKGHKHIEYVPIRDYYHRHQRAYFWEGATVAPYGNNVIFRNLFGWIYPVNVQMFKLIVPTAAKGFLEKIHVLQDFMVPISKMEAFIQFTHKEVEIYPIWLCPVKFFPHPTMAHASGSKEELYVDIGIYGDTKNVETYDRLRSIQKFEKLAIENNGYQFLYADCFLSRDDFGKMFDMRHYDKVREKYKCNDAFPHVYDKVSAHVRH